MTRRHAITPTDNGLPPANPAWRYSPPKVSRDGRTVVIDAMQPEMVEAYYRAVGVPTVDELRQAGKIR